MRRLFYGSLHLGARPLKGLMEAERLWHLAARSCPFLLANWARPRQLTDEFRSLFPKAVSNRLHVQFHLRHLLGSV